MIKVALLTWFNSVNYGTCLQAYALTYKLKSVGCDVYLPDDMRYRSWITLRDTGRRVKRHLLSKVKAASSECRQNNGNIDLAGEYEMRVQKKKHFLEEHFQMLHMDSRQSFANLNKEMDIFITGSDQIWNPYYLSLAALLCFVDEEKPKIAYASSVGVDQLPGDLIPVYKKYLDRFSAISVRERCAAEYLSALLGKEVKHVLDPTFLLGVEEIHRLEARSEWAGKTTAPKNYIVCYFVGNSRAWEDAVKQVSAHTQLPVIVIMSENGIVPSVGTPVAFAGAYDFLWLIDHAAYVCTDSFHCTAFSINLNKEFFVFKRFADTDPGSQNARLYDLLRVFGLSDRVVSSDVDISQILARQIDYDSVMQKVCTERQKSEQYLVNALDYASYATQKR